MHRRYWLSPLQNNDFWEPSKIFNHFFPQNYQDFWGRNDFGPSIDLQETERAIIIKADLPGVNQEDLDITVDEHNVHLKGELRQEENRDEKGYHLTERRYGSFYRTIALPTEVVSEQATASYKNGVLELNIPKAEKITRGFKPHIETDEKH
jgi:HSP20 family protein